MPIERIEQGMHLQEFPAGGDKGTEVPRAFGAFRQMPVTEFSVQEREDFEFELRHAPVVDPFPASQVSQTLPDALLGQTGMRGRAFLKLSYLRNGNVQDIEKMPAGRAVGTRS